MKAIEMFKTMTAEEIADTIVKKIDSFTNGVPRTGTEFVRIFEIDEEFDGLDDCPFDCEYFDEEDPYDPCPRWCYLPEDKSCPFGRNRSEVRRKCIIRWLNKEV